MDIGLGRPAEGVSGTLTVEGALVASGLTDAEGRVRGLGTDTGSLGAGSYRLTFAVRDYFAKTAREASYREGAVQFEIGDGNEHYHVPLLLGPFGYTTYRDSQLRRRGRKGQRPEPPGAGRARGGARTDGGRGQPQEPRAGVRRVIHQHEHRHPPHHLETRGLDQPDAPGERAARLMRSEE